MVLLRCFRPLKAEAIYFPAGATASVEIDGIVVATQGEGGLERAPGADATSAVILVEAAG